MRALCSTIAVVLFVGCSTPVAPDAGQPPDAATQLRCTSSADCRSAGFEGVCRQGVCVAAVPCADDLECGLHEGCRGAVCAFVGCLGDADCATGRCRTQTQSCVECGASLDCPFDRPVCDVGKGTCVRCTDDSQCPSPGPGYCSVTTGACVFCQKDEQCPNGLNCDGHGVCAGVAQGQSCPMGTACALGLTCVTYSSGGTACLIGCTLVAPVCPAGQICYALKTGNASYIFEQGRPSGVCFDTQPGLKSYHDACSATLENPTGNCQNNLQCIAESATEKRCRSFCDPHAATNPCPSPEVCHSFPGDSDGHPFGLCFADNGFGTPCSSDAVCRPGQSCRPYPDPSAFTEYSPVCQFNVGPRPGLSPCSPTTTADGGAVSADKVCASGACVGDALPQSPDYFCFSSCAVDADCAIGQRTGTCEAAVDFPLVPGDGGFDISVRACRPGCTSNASCAEYGAAFVCRPRLVASSTAPAFKANCGLPSGSLGAGAACLTGSQCRSGNCQTLDSRNVTRHGFCLEACAVTADCTGSPDGGDASGPLDCRPTAGLGDRGPDAVVGTADDKYVVASLCAGGACASDEACGGDGGVRCVPEASATDLSTLALRCRPSTAGVLEAAEVCSADAQCASGACAVSDGADGGVKRCFRACDPGSSCPVGTSCRATYSFGAPGGPVTFSGCAP